VPVEVILPQLGMVQTDALLVEWLRAEGEQVAEGDPVAVIQTDKADVELEAPAQGTLVAQALAPGESAPVGTVIAYIIGPGETTPARPSLTGSSTIAARTELESRQPRRAAVDDAGDGCASCASAGPELRASPGARRLAAELGVDLASVSPTGPGGRVTEADVRAAADSAREEMGPERPLTRARQVTADRMALSFQTIPHLYLETTLEASMIVSASSEGVTVTDVLLHAIAKALRAHPGLNATFRDNKLFEFAHINLGLGVDTPAGLYVPVLADADRLELSELSAKRAQAVDRARQGALSVGDLGDATFTVTNLGVFDVDAAWPIVNPPGVATLAVGRIRRQPVVVGDDVVVRPLLRLVLAADHRAIDGAEAARFLETLKGELASGEGRDS
jgi:pyruvate dehydrogenase E2 component (dihydrolipoyllysine-residue acetyltransferase)